MKNNIEKDPFVTCNAKLPLWDCAWKLLLILFLSREFIPGLEVSWLLNAEYYNCAITELEMEVSSGELRGRMLRWSGNQHLCGEALTTAPAIPPLSSIQEQ